LFITSDQQYEITITMPRIVVDGTTMYLPTEMLCEMMKNSLENWSEIVSRILSKGLDRRLIPHFERF